MPNSLTIKELAPGLKVVNILGTNGVDMPEEYSADSWIKYWEKYSHQERSCCCAQGCNRTDVTGGHVKIASGPIAAVLKTKWYIVPACHKHNRGSSCKTFKVKAVTAAEAPPSLTDRFLSYPADLRKAFRTAQGKR